MLDREQLETFATVAEHGSFDRAAAVLHVTRGAVSQRIKSLEDSLSIVLLVREKPVRPTARGELLLRHVKALRILESSLLRELTPQASAQPASVAVAVNADSLAGWFSSLVPTLVTEQGIALEIVSDDQDHTFKRLARGEVIGCVSTESQARPGFVADPLGSMEYLCVSAPQFAARHFGDGLSPRSVLTAPAVLFDRKDSLHDEFLLSAFGFKVERYVRHYVPSPWALLDIIVAGCAYGLVPVAQARSGLQSGQLVDLAPGRPLLVALYWHHWEGELPLAGEITRRVLRRARAELIQPPAAARVPPS